MNGTNNGQLPGWAKIAKDVGIPAAVAFWLLYWLPSMDRRLTELVVLMQQHLIQQVR